MLSLTSSIGSPLRLDDTTASQKLLTYARILINLDLSKEKPTKIKVNLEGDSRALLSISYENFPCSNCLSARHSEKFCRFGLAVTKAIATLSTQFSKDILGKPPHLPPTSLTPLLFVQPPPLQSTQPADLSPQDPQSSATMAIPHTSPPLLVLIHQVDTVDLNKPTIPATVFLTPVNNQVLPPDLNQVQRNKTSPSPPLPLARTSPTTPV